MVGDTGTRRAPNVAFLMELPYEPNINHRQRTYCTVYSASRKFALISLPVVSAYEAMVLHQLQLKPTSPLVSAQRRRSGPGLVSFFLLACLVLLLAIPANPERFWSSLDPFETFLTLLYCQRQ